MKPEIAIVGAGYVGVPLAQVFAEAGRRVVLVDVSEERAAMLNRGESYVEDVPNEVLKRLVAEHLLTATTDYDVLREADAILIALPTPLSKQREPDLSILLSAVAGIAKRLRTGHLIVLESTTYPGTTREEVLPALEATGLKVGEDFFLAFSPERVDPGRTDWTTKNVPKVVDAAATKPFGFMPFSPGPGLGGHCIPIDPFYLTWKAREFGFYTEFIELAGKVNEEMPYFCRSLVSQALNHAKEMSLKGSKVLVLGVAYKPDIGDMRESPALKLISLLRNAGADVSYHDPHVPSFAEHGLEMRSVPFDPGAYDCVVIVTDHSEIDYEQLVDDASLVVDLRNATGTKGTASDKVFKL